MIIDGALPTLIRSFSPHVLFLDGAVPCRIYFDGAVLNYDEAVPNKFILTELLPPPSEKNFKKSLNKYGLCIGRIF